ncbi:MAG: hypothetical protein HZA36_00325 [Parcubacteria group bacterium]|nr:hypothetical protein [Parcubacteria group bacterium]
MSYLLSSSVTLFLLIGLVQPADAFSLKVPAFFKAALARLQANPASGLAQLETGGTPPPTMTPPSSQPAPQSPPPSSPTPTPGESAPPSTNNQQPSTQYQPQQGQYQQERQRDNQTMPNMPKCASGQTPSRENPCQMTSDKMSTLPPCVSGTMPSEATPCKMGQDQQVQYQKTNQPRPNQERPEQQNKPQDQNRPCLQGGARCFSDQDQEPNQQDQDVAVTKMMLAQWTKAVKQLETLLAKAVKLGIGSPQTVADALSKVKTLLTSSPSDIDPQTLSEYMDTLREEQQQLQRLTQQWTQMMKMINAGIAQATKSYKNDQKTGAKLALKGSDLSKTLNEEQTLLTQITTARDTAVSLMKEGKRDEAFETLSDMKDLMDTFFEKSAFIQMVNNSKNFVSSSKKIPAQLKSYIAKLNKKDIDTTELQSLADELISKINEVAALLKSPDTDPETLMSAMEEYYGLISQIRDWADANAEGVPLPQLSNQQSYQQFTIPQGFGSGQGGPQQGPGGMGGPQGPGGFQQGPRVAGMPSSGGIGTSAAGQQ